MPGDYQTDRRMALKRQAIPLPSFTGKAVLDVGTDHAYWAFLAADLGASDVLGLDRNRNVQGVETDLIRLNMDEAEKRGAKTRFERINLGREWREFGRFDVILVMSVYHHIYEQCGDHRPIWFWLSRHCKADGQIIWEGPIDDSDAVVRANVSEGNRAGYSLDAILAAAGLYFEAEYVGPALHEPTRQVWRFRPKVPLHCRCIGEMRIGAGGASAAFLHANGRRCQEVFDTLGFQPLPGSLNIQLAEPFDWERDFYRAKALDVAERGKGLNVEWLPRWARFYPVTVDGVPAFVFRFEGERYPESFVELIAAERLRDCIPGPTVQLCR
jgi:2-polyprenyl-3-methyl-5-hydroxy-6-metoxy-1,4-benzoquinol methylase